MFFLRLPEEYKAFCYFCGREAADWFCEDCGIYYCHDCMDKLACEGSNLLKVQDIVGT